MNLIAKDPAQPHNSIKRTASRNWWLSSFYIFLSAIVLGVIGFATFRPIVVLPRIRLAPGFSFNIVGQDATIYSDELRGSLTFYTFTYSDCVTAAPAHCQQSAEAIKSLQAQIEAADNGVLPIQVVTVLLDQSIVEPDKIKHLANDENWLIVQGDPLKTRYAVGQGFNLFYAFAGEGDRSEAYVTPKVVLVDGLGMIRNEYRTHLPDGELIERDIGLLTQEYQNRNGVSRIGYEAAHLFVCYP